MSNLREMECLVAFPFWEKACAFPFWEKASCAYLFREKAFACPKVFDPAMGNFRLYKVAPSERALAGLAPSEELTDAGPSCCTVDGFE